MITDKESVFNGPHLKHLTCLAFFFFPGRLSCRASSKNANAKSENCYKCQGKRADRLDRERLCRLRIRKLGVIFASILCFPDSLGLHIVCFYFPYLKCKDRGTRPAKLTQDFRRRRRRCFFPFPTFLSSS